MKNKKLILKILIFSLILLSAQTMWAENTSPEPYTENEFPQGLKDLRRFEIISLGSMPFVTFNTSLVYSGIRYARHDFNSAYAPNLFATSSYSAEEQREIILTSLGISIGIGLTDYIIQLIKRSKKNRQLELENENLYIIPLAEDQDASPIEIPQTEDDEVQEVSD